MALAIEAVLPVRFDGFLRKRPFAIVFLGNGSSVPRPRAVLEGVDQAFPRQVSAGWLARDAVPDDGWWARHWRTDLGPYQRGAVPPAGVYLFHMGYVVGHSPATASSGGLTEWLRVREYLLERMRLKDSQGGDGTEWTWQSKPGDSPGGRRTREPEPDKTRVVRADDPYALLEVAASADDADVKKAFRTAIKLNHPDRVAHLSKAIQAFAHERTQLILAAWDRIKEERGIR